LALRFSTSLTTSWALAVPVDAGTVTTHAAALVGGRDLCFELGGIDGDGVVLGAVGVRGGRHLAGVGGLAVNDDGGGGRRGGAAAG
jgi:hypothetical protein